MDNQSLRVLMIKDSEEDVLLIIRMLKKGGYNPVYERIETIPAMKKALKGEQWDIILCDYEMPKFSASSAIALLKETNINIPLIVVTGTIGEETAAESMRLGAKDYVMKSNLSRLCPAIARELKEAEGRRKQKLAEEALNASEVGYRRLFESAKDGVLILNANTGMIVNVNPFLINLLGFSREELLERAVWEIGPFKDVIPNRKNFLELQRKGYIRYEDMPLETKEGRLINVEFVSNVYEVDHAKVIQCNIRDITERKHLTDSLHKAKSELEQRVAERTIELQDALAEIKTMKDKLEAENIYFRQEHKMKNQFDNIIGQSDGFKYVLYRAEQVAPSNTTVLILGETGTGKELISSVIHNMSPRKERPLITVSCATLPCNLIESELFGREKGAFTGADSREVGRFEIANGSTLCLDEIGELPLDLQAKLLRVIQHNEFERLGSSRTIKVDVRIIATTNRNLNEEVRKGRFRQDLYYRLNVFPITVPPLRLRKDDIPLMVEAFVERYCRKLGKKITTIKKETMNNLQNYPWPGNVRELESVIERAIILCPGHVLQLADILEVSSPTLSSSMITLEDVQRSQILKVLQKTKWRIEGKDGAAAILGIHPSTLRARMHKLEIMRPNTRDLD